jgi:arylsulfatase A
MCLGPAEWGFDEHIVFRGSGRYWRDQADFYNLNGQRKDLPAGVYLPDLMHDFVLDFITRQKEKPFFIYYSLSHIHAPIVRTPDSKPGSNHYADNIAYMDKLVGKLAAELERLKLREKTLLIFTGDNGTAGNAQKAPVNGKPLSGHKATMLEGGSRVPLIANWPGTTPAGKVNRDLIDFSDFMATFAELAGAELPKERPIDGQSFAPQLKGQKGQPREWVYVELDGRSYARNARWKLTNSGDLFDMKDAPFSEIPVPKDTPDAEALAARKQLQQVLDSHPAVPPTGAPRGAKQKQKAKSRAQQP